MLSFSVGGPAVAGPSQCAKIFGPEAGPFENFFSRTLGQKLNPTYLEHMILATKRFCEWCVPGAKEENYSQFFAELHKLAVLGDGRGPIYWPDEHTPWMGSELAGKYRNELTRNGTGDFLTHRMVLAPEVIAKINAYKSTFITEPADGPVPMVLFLPRIDGIPYAGVPRFMILANREVVFGYPPPQFVPAYVEAMSTAMKRIRAQLILPATAIQTDAVLRDLARYYHLGVVGHPFLRVNNSLLMAQVNAVLAKLGKPAVAHGDLDYVLRSLGSHEAEVEFLAYVAR